MQKVDPHTMTPQELKLCLEELSREHQELLDTYRKTRKHISSIVDTEREYQDILFQKTGMTSNADVVVLGALDLACELLAKNIRWCPGAVDNKKPCNECKTSHCANMWKTHLIEEFLESTQVQE